MDENTPYGWKAPNWQINISPIRLRDWWVNRGRKKRAKRNAKYKWVYKCG